MSEAEKIICDFFVRAISGAAALVVGTGLCYFLFVGRYLRSLEHYKERLRVYKELDKLIAETVLIIGFLKGEPKWVGPFSGKMDAFNEYVGGENRLFMSPALKGHCQCIKRTAEEMMPEQYPESPGTLTYPEMKLSKLDDEFHSLRKFIEAEIAASQFGIPPEIIKWWSQMQRRLSGQSKR